MKYNFLAFLVLCGCVPLTQSSSITESNSKTLKFTDYTYEPEIRTVLLHPGSTTLLPAVTELGQSNLVLEFDDLRPQRENYNARIIHCNHDWTQSNLMDLDFLSIYNEFIITNYRFSIDTQIPYVRYSFNIPAVKYSGNYMVVVYRDGNKNDFVLTKRFMVYDNQISFTKTDNLVNSGSVARLNQQINFTISYRNLEILNPLENIWVVVRQNQRWDNLATDIKPSFIRDFEHELEYRFFDEKKMFKGGNEFRFFDLRSLNYPGRNVDHMDKKTKPVEAFIQKDISRSNEAYSQYLDLDGNFTIGNLDYNDIDFANYVYVNFSLAVPKIDGNVYVTGAFNYWNLTKENRMQYDTATNQYKGRVLLKQGRYDYQYFVKSPTLTPYHFEGTHFETQNSYEIFVYYRPIKPRAELLIGYLKLEANPR